MECEEKQMTESLETKYKLRKPRDLRSKFLLTMEQKKIDKENAEKNKLEKEENLRILVNMKNSGIMLFFL